MIKAEVIEVAQEIEEAEVEDEIKREEEEEELEIENEMKDIEEQEKEFANNDNESKEIISETSIVEEEEGDNDAITSSSQLTNTTFVGMIPSPIDYKAEESMNNNENTASRDNVVIEEEEGIITKVEQPRSEISPTASTLPHQSSTMQYPLEQSQTTKLLSHQSTAIPHQSLLGQQQQQPPIQEQAIDNTSSIVKKEEELKEATSVGNVTEIQDGDESINVIEVEDNGDEVVAADSNGSSISNSLIDEQPQVQASLIVQQPPPPIIQPQMEPPLVTEPLFQSPDSESANIGGYNNIPASPIDLPNVGDTISDTP